MCGLLFWRSEDADTTVFKNALQGMVSRGPDWSAIERINENTLLGHNRLKILDLDQRSNQPFYSSDGRYALIYNGEIYNYREIAKKYALQLRTTSDTEVLVELYAKLGARALQEFNGMFAFVIIDRQSGSVFAARDRLGIKPLYISDGAEGLIFSSEIRAILDLGVAPEPDAIGIRQYLKMRAFFNGHTIYQGVSMLEAGHYWLDGRSIRYWDLEESAQPGGRSDTLVRDLIESAVNYRCISDVTVGSYLSGGLDSTIVAALAGKPDTWTVGFESDNEFEWGRLAAESMGASHTEVLVPYDDFLPTAEALLKHRREPLSVPNEVLLYKMTQAVAEKNTVVLSGEGADELFYGYDRIFRWANDSEWSLTGFDKHYSYGGHQDDEIIDSVISKADPSETCLTTVSRFFQKHHLHGLLRRLDNSTMMCSVEARVPFVDHRLIEYMWGASFDYRMSNGVVKAPLKRIFDDLLPDGIITRKKIGFPVPLEKFVFPESRDGGFDGWLDFNLRSVFAERWDELRQEIMPRDLRSSQ